MTPASSASGGEWLSPFRGDPPEPLREHVRAVQALVDAVPVTPLVEGSVAVPDRARVVSIFGSRGTGKSTVLQFAVEALKETPGNLVLPVIDPEAFAPGDSLAGWVFAHLERELQQDDQAQRIGSEAPRSLGQQLEDLKRGQAVRSSSYLPGLEQRGLNFDDFARDAVKVPAHGVLTPYRVVTLLDGLSRARPGDDTLKLVIAIDDADLYPELLPSIVGDAQMLGASPRTVIIFAADRQTLARSLEIAYLSTHGGGVATALTHGLIHGREIREQVGRRLVKHFPRSLRVMLPTLGPEERLRFRPLDSGTDLDLLGLVGRFAIDNSVGRTSLADIFTIRSVSGHVLATSPYARALSNNARDLRQLYDALMTVDSRSFREPASEALATILRHGLDNLEPDVSRAVHDSLVLMEEGDRIGVEFDFNGIGFGKAVGKRSLVYMGGASEDEPEDWPMSSAIVLRTMVNHYSDVRDDEDVDEPDVDERTPSDRKSDREQLPEQYTHLAVLAWEAAEESLLEPRRTVRRMINPGGPNWAGLVEGTPRNEAWSYWLVPDWEQFSDFFCYQEAWNRMIALVDEADADGREVIEWLLISHLDLVATIQLHRAVPDWTQTLTSDGLERLVQPDEWAKRREPLKAELAARLLEALSAARSGNRVRDGDYQTWFMLHLPMAATPLLTTHGLSTWLVGIWKGATLEIDREPAVELVAGYAADHITNTMADGDITLLKMIEPVGRGPSRVQALESVRDHYRRQEEEQRQRLLMSLRQAGAGEEIVDALQSRGMTRNVALGLVQAGVEPAQLTAIARAFPAPAANEPDDDEGPPRR